MPVIMERQIICSTTVTFVFFMLMWIRNDGALSSGVPPKVMLPATIVRALPDYVLSCSATGTPPIYTAMIRKKKRKNRILVVDFHVVGMVPIVEIPFLATCACMVSRRLRYLQLLRNVSSIPDDIFSNFPNIRSLDLRSNNFPNLEENIFANLTKLQTLHLSSNKIHYLPKGLFSSLRELKYLQFRENSIQDLPENIFSNLINLKKLELNSNKIPHLPKGLFCCQNKLEYLNLASNNIENLPASVFSNLTNLKLLLSGRGWDEKKAGKKDGEWKRGEPVDRE
ncbi:uncharacterized protein LOC144659197 [Oculina patagonica]